MRYGEGTSHPRQHVPDLKPKCGSYTFSFFHQHKLDNSPESMDQHQIDHQLIIPSTVSCALTFNGWRSYHEPILILNVYTCGSRHNGLPIPGFLLQSCCCFSLFPSCTLNISTAPPSSVKITKWNIIQDAITTSQSHSTQQEKVCMESRVEHKVWSETRNPSILLQK